MWKPSTNTTRNAWAVHGQLWSGGEIPWRQSDVGSDVDVPLREGDLDALGGKLRVNRRIQRVSYGQAITQGGQEATQREIQRAVTEVLESDRGGGILQNVRVFGDDLQD